jgi:hypothetical protein
MRQWSSEKTVGSKPEAKAADVRQRRSTDLMAKDKVTLKIGIEVIQKKQNRRREFDSRRRGWLDRWRSAEV